MSKTQAPPSSPVDAVKQVYAALEPFDDQARKRIMESVASLLGMRPFPIPADSSAGAAVSSAGKAEAITQTSGSRPLSPVELIQQKQPSTNPQKIAVFAYYRERVEGLARFSRADLEPYFAKAKQPAPGNYGRDFQTAVSMGWIYEDGADSYLTTKGLEAVEVGFEGKAQPRGGTTVKRKKPTGKRIKKRVSRRS